MSVFSSTPGKFADNPEAVLRTRYNVVKDGLDRKLLMSARLKEYSVKPQILESLYGLERYGATPEGITKLINNDVFITTIPKVLHINKDGNGTLLSYISCMPPDPRVKGSRPCVHVFNVTSINSTVKVNYRKKHLQHWRQFEDEIRKLIKSFIVE